MEGGIMPRNTKRVTVYLDDELHKALKLKAVETDKPVSTLINDAIRETYTNYSADNAERWLEDSFELMDQAMVNSGGIKWKRDELYDA